MDSWRMMADTEVSRGRLRSCCLDDDDNDMEEEAACQKGGHAPWTRGEGSRAALGRLKAKLFETRLAAHVRQAQLVLADSIKQAGWAVEHKVSEVSRRGWSEATRAWGSGGSGGGTLALTSSSGGPHERSSLLLGPGDGYQRLDNNRCNDSWGDDNWTNDWGSSNNSKPSSPTQTQMDSPEPSPNARVSKKNANNSCKKNKGSVKKDGKAEQELLVDLGNNGTKGHTWDNWDDDWEKVEGQ
ncbi:hypothetical protein OTU49_016653 [Cherax quadricarinatus]|uniref:Uncharacterized protein n=1 Tax=Cherax quadricarinatus TaxID=27406 RepID=A0AAW0Y541_CHEQU